MDYIDDYSACSLTYATLRIYPKEYDAEYVTGFIGVNPTRISKKDPQGKSRAVNGWFLSSKDSLGSKDSRRHIDWVLDKIASSISKVKELRSSGAKVDICCYWESASGNGGPTISPAQMKRLVDFDIEVWWDVWFDFAENSDA